MFKVIHFYTCNVLKYRRTQSQPHSIHEQTIRFVVLVPEDGITLLQNSHTGTPNPACTVSICQMPYLGHKERGKSTNQTYDSHA